MQAKQLKKILKTLMFSLEFSANGWNEYLYWQEHDSKQAKRINRLIQECSRTPYEGIGKPEPLKWKLQGCWSRRIDEEHRLIYKVENNKIIIISCCTHYKK